MSFVKKLKDILFEEEEYTEPIKIRETKREEDVVEEKPILIEERQSKEFRTPKNEDFEKDLLKSDNDFKFPDFDEEEFASSMQTRINTNVLDVERKKSSEKKNEYTRLEKYETKEVPEKKKFKPSPIISPVYGILNQDYKAEDIVKKEDDALNISIDEVRKKAYPSENKKEEIKKEINSNDKKESPKIENVIDEPVVTFFDEKNDIETLDDVKDNYKTIDDLLEESSSEITIDDTLELPKTNNLEAIEEELEKIDSEEKHSEKTKDKNLEDTLDSDLFELIDSMYDEREEG